MLLEYNLNYAQYPRARTHQAQESCQPSTLIHQVHRWSLLSARYLSTPLLIPSMTFTVTPSTSYTYLYIRVSHVYKLACTLQNNQPSCSILLCSRILQVTSLNNIDKLRNVLCCPISIEFGCEQCFTRFPLFRITFWLIPINNSKYMTGSTSRHHDVAWL
jgi:hypothetical protein